MLRILHVIGSMQCGGTETLLMNIYRNIDRSKIQFDFVVHTNVHNFYEDEIEKLGGKIYRTRKFNVFNYFSYKKYWKDFFNNHQEYKIVHGHINSSALIYLKAAKKQGIVTVIHSHATRNNEKNIRSVVFLIAAYPIRFIADYFFGCSRQAGLDRFGENVVNSDRFQVLNNGIESRKFIYDIEKRKKVRDKEKVSENMVVIGHVGRFTYAKNHKFIIELFEEYHKFNPESELWLIGKGELEEKISNMVNERSLTDCVRFLGQKRDVSAYLNAMDVFIFPSLFEGLGISLVEAQATGLPCVVSENIQEEADIQAGLVHKLRLSDDLQDWVEKINEYKGFQRQDTSENVKKVGFEIQLIAEKLQRFYLDIMRLKK